MFRYSLNCRNVQLFGALEIDIDRISPRGMPHRHLADRPKKRVSLRVIGVSPDTLEGLGLGGLDDKGLPIGGT